MHRATALTSSFRAYTGGGARSAVNQADDSHLMQESAGNFMAGEARQAIELPQNYGFTSVVMDAIQGAAGQASQMIGQFVASAESMISFMGSNRSFPVAGVMDDRRHRLQRFGQGRYRDVRHAGPDATDSDIERRPVCERAERQNLSHGCDRRQQSAGHDEPVVSIAAGQRRRQSSRQLRSMTATIWNATRRPFRRTLCMSTARACGIVSARYLPLNITNYSHVVPIPTSFDSGVRRRRRRCAGGAGGQSGMKMGQSSLKSKNQQAKIFVDATKDATRASGKIVQLIMGSSSSGGSSGRRQQPRTKGRERLPIRLCSLKLPRRPMAAPAAARARAAAAVKIRAPCLAEASSDSKFYCGGTPSKGKYALIVTVKGPTINVPGRIG